MFSHSMAWLGTTGKVLSRVPLWAALRATRSVRCADRACSPGPSGLRSGAVQVEREFPEDALGPAHSALLRARRLCADPQALSPLFLPGERRTRARLRQRRCICDATALARTRLADTSTVRVAPCAGAVTVSRA